MMVHGRGFLAFLLITLFVSAAASERVEFALARDGEAVAHIIAVDGVETGSPAAELERYLERIAGADFQVASSGSPPAVIVRQEKGLGRAVRIGQSDGQGNIVIAGSDERETLLAVYAFLYKLGCRWFMPGDIGEVIPQKRNLSVRPAAEPFTPSLYLRNHWYAWGTEDTTGEQGRRFYDWHLRNYNTGHPITHGHNLLTPVPPQKYMKEHPEYYALVAGERQPTQPCTTNPDAIRIFIDYINDYFDRNPQATSWSLCPEDNTDFCECQRCRALDIDEPDPIIGEPQKTDRIITFCNIIAEGVAKKHPDKVLSTYAYVNYTAPPRRVRPHPNVAIFVTASAFDPAHSVAHKFSRSRQKMLAVLKGWTGMSKRVYIYEYDPSPYVYGSHCPLFMGNAGAMRIYRKLGIGGISFESYKSWGPLFPNYYFNSQMMWDADEDPQALLKDLCEKFFGPAAKAMHGYYTTLESAFSANAYNPGWGTGRLWRMYAPAIVDECGEALRQAEAAPLSDVQRERVQMVRYAYDYTRSYRTMMSLLGSEGFDFWTLQSAARRCMTLYDVMYRANSDFVLRGPGKRQFERSMLDVEAAYVRSRQWREDVESVALPVVWSFRHDPENEGEKQGWYAADYHDKTWDGIRTDSQWLDQLDMQPKLNKHGWARARFRIPASWKGRRIYLRFGAVDEQGWIYVNGQFVGSHPEGEDGLSWIRPFTVDITSAARPGQVNLVAVHAFADEGLGGVWKPVHAFTPKRADFRIPGPLIGPRE